MKKEKIQLTKYEQLKGKTINTISEVRANYNQENTFAIHFTDGSFALFYGNLFLLTIKPDKWYNLGELREWGLISEEEHIRRKKERTKKCDKKTQERDLAEYRRLKEKLEAKSLI